MADTHSQPSADGGRRAASRRGPTLSPRGRALTAIAVFTVALAARVPLMSEVGFHGDQLQFLAWSERVTQGPLTSAYETRPDQPERRWCNYPPLYLYVLRGTGELYPAVVGRPLDEATVASFADSKDPTFMSRTAALLKAPAVIADALLAALLVIWLAPRWGLFSAATIGLFYAFIPAVIHDSAVWGQTDGVLALLLVVSLEFARRGNLPGMAGAATAALLMKAQAIMLLPVWAAVLWHDRAQRSTVLQAAVVALLVAAAVLAPFTAALDGVADAYLGAAGYYPYTHLNGFSLWFLHNPIKQPSLEYMSAVYKRDDGALAFGITPRGLGLAAVLILWIASFVYQVRRSADAASVRAAALCLPLGFFMLATQMHERYLLPALAIWAWGYQPTGRWRVCFLLLAICCSINVLWAWPGPHPAGYTATLAVVLRQSPLGLAMGAWCAGALVLLLVDSIREWGRSAPAPTRA